jgi:hypothetical protein
LFNCIGKLNGDARGVWRSLAISYTVLPVEVTFHLTFQPGGRVEGLVTVATISSKEVPKKDSATSKAK